MNLTGRIVGITTNFLTKKCEVMLAIQEQNKLTAGYEELKEQRLDICIKKHREKRSLNANAYFHVMVSKLADRLRISKVRCKNLMIGRYGQAFRLDETTEAVIKTNIPVNQMLESELVHCMPCGHKIEGRTEVIFYKVLRGSSTYDTQEMGRLIHGVVDECQEQGIETIPPDELERMLKQWKV